MNFRKLFAMFCRLLLLILLAAVLTRCTPTPTNSSATPTPPITPWGLIHTLALAESSAAPLGVDQGVMMFAWAGADAQEARLYAQSADAAAPTILALKAHSPLDVQMLPAANGRFHLLWRDDVEGTPHLFYGLFNDQAVAEFGAYDLSETSLYNFAALPQSDGSLRVAYSAGWVAEPRLFLQDIDGRGRSQFPMDLKQAGDFPAFLSEGSAIWLYWQTEDGRTWQGHLAGSALVDPQAITQGPMLNVGDAIMSLTAAGDATYHYLLWQVVRADGTPETWFAVGEKTRLTWSPALRLTIPTLGTSAIETGYRVGTVTAAERGADAVGWGRVLAGMQPIVPIAVQTGDTLGVAYLEAGNIIGYQALVSVQGLIAPPVLVLRPDRSLLVAWSEPRADAAALRWMVSQG